MLIKQFDNFDHGHISRATPDKLIQGRLSNIYDDMMAKIDILYTAVFGELTEERNIRGNK